MREFYVSEMGHAIKGPMELQDALDSISFWINPDRKRSVLEQYAKGECYEWHFTYGFNCNATVTVWLDHIK